MENFSENKIVYMMKNSRGELVEDLRLNYPYLPEGVKDLFTDVEKNKLFKPSPGIPENHPLNLILSTSLKFIQYFIILNKTPDFPKAKSNTSTF